MQMKTWLIVAQYRDSELNQDGKKKGIVWHHWGKTFSARDLNSRLGSLTASSGWYHGPLVQIQYATITYKKES